MNPLDQVTVPLHGTTLIEASAGTGKTYTIATLFLRLLLERRLEVSQILVVTYTRAATAELRDRIRRRLIEALAALDADSRDDNIARLVAERRRRGELDADRGWLLQAVRDFDQAAIFTIHAFCQQTLGECAFESRAPFELDLSEDQRPLLREVALDCWAREVYAADRAVVGDLRAAKLDPDRLASLAAVAVRDPAMPVLPETAPAGDHALGLRRRLVDYARAEIRRRRSERGVFGFDDLLHQLGTALAGAGGPLLAARVRERHPAALIDEFQDTDPVQYGIFRAIYGERGGLFLIGDPKQAIYGFRGADVFAYMQAARLAGSAVYTLNVNYRSDPRLVHALSTLFSRRERPFLFPEIQFEPVREAREARERLSPPGPSLQLLFVTRSEHNCDRGNPKNVIIKRWADAHLPRRIAREIVHLLHSDARIDGDPIKPRHVAVLCRTNAQARLTQAALAALGVPTVLEGDSSVFEGETAEELARVLWAIAEPADARKLGAALASAIFGVDGTTLLRVRGDETELERWLDRLARWNQLWHERGFVPMMQKLLDDADVQPRLLARNDGERRLTDLLHLIELLHRASVEQHLGPLSLLHWYAQVRSDPQTRSVVADSEQMRLEHDEHAVRLTTVHRSKGLEYPIVFCPFLWSVIDKDRRPDKDVRFHDRDDADRVKLDLGSTAFARHKAAADREELAENLRVAYVALTRAKHRCYAVWGRFRNSGSSPLGYLLHRGPAGAIGTGDVESSLKPLSDEQLRAELQALCEASQGSIGVRDLRDDAPARYDAAERAPGLLAARTPARKHAPWPRMTSFSRLTADATLAEVPAHAAELPDHDESDPEAPEPDALGAASAAQDKIVLHAFPSGSRPGSLIHAVYEHVDFERGDPGQLAAEVDRQLALFGVDPAQHRDALLRGLAQTLLTPLDTGTPPLTLARIPRSARVDELEFTLSAGAAPHARLAERLAAAFTSCGAPACDPLYAQRLRALGSAPPAAFVKGFMDLVFRHEGRFYVADYKSNRLGEHAADYTLPRLVRSMREHHYFLQYHLYVVALDRHLALRVPDYDYDRHFGGVYYLYLRGMSPEHPRGTGVFFDRPPHALIKALATALGGDAESEAPA